MFEIIGMVHLRPLPGSVRYDGSWQRVIDDAVADACALEDGGVDAIMVENFGDIPFRRDHVEPHTVASMAVLAAEIRRRVSLPIGINVLRNDARSALAIAAAVGAAMIRVNVHTGAMLTDQGIIQGDAAATLAYRALLGADVRIFADVNVKHAQPLAAVPIEDAAADAVERGLADALIVTGPRTGAAVDLDQLARVRAAVSVPVYAGSGVDADSISRVAAECNGAIVGSWLKREGRVGEPVDISRVRRLVAASGR